MPKILSACWALWTSSISDITLFMIQLNMKFIKTQLKTDMLSIQFDDGDEYQYRRDLFYRMFASFVLVSLISRCKYPITFEFLILANAITRVMSWLFFSLLKLQSSMNEVVFSCYLKIICDYNQSNAKHRLIGGISWFYRCIFITLWNKPLEFDLKLKLLTRFQEVNGLSWSWCSFNIDFFSRHF